MVRTLLASAAFLTASTSSVLAQRLPSLPQFTGYIVGTGIDPLTWGTALIFSFLRIPWWQRLTGALALYLTIGVAILSLRSPSYSVNWSPLLYGVLATVFWFGLFMGIRRLRRPRAAAAPVSELSAKAAYDGGQYASAFEQFEKLARSGSTDAQFNVGIMYAEGRGMTQDFVRGYMWLTIAATTGDPEAVRNRDLIAQKMSQTQIGEAQNLARMLKVAAHRSA